MGCRTLYKLQKLKYPQYQNKYTSNVANLSAHVIVKYTIFERHTKSQDLTIEFPEAKP